MKYDVFLFDLDDTLMDFGETEKNAFTNVFTTHGFPNALADYRGTYRAVSTVLWEDLEQGRTTLADLKTERFEGYSSSTALKWMPKRSAKCTSII